MAYGLGFVLMTTEQYDLVIPGEVWELEIVQSLMGWIASEDARGMITRLGGYDTSLTGHVEWIE
jgi:molybdate-binding protein